MRRRPVLLAFSVLTAVLMFAAPASAQLRHEPRPTPVPVHLALGDSVAAGVGASDPVATGYVPLVTAALRAELTCGASGLVPCRRLRTENLAVSGATTTTLIAEQLPAALEALAARTGGHPVDDVEVITLDIGGNDVFLPLLQACAAGVTPECVAVAQQRLALVATNLDVILGALREAAPDAEIVVTTYDNPLAACQLAALSPLGDLVLEGGEVLPAGLNDVIRATAAAYDVRVAEIYGALSLEDWVGGQDCLHPDDSGHAIIADLVAAAVVD